MKSRIVYEPRFQSCWLVEQKQPGLFKPWVQVDRYKDKNEAIKIATEVMKSGVVWTSDGANL